MKKNLFFSSSFLTAALIAGMIALPVFAAPLQNPPNGNVNANFFSVTASSGTLGGLTLAAGAIANPSLQNGGLIQLFDPEGLAISTDSSALNNFKVSGIGNISNEGSLLGGMVQVADDQGFSVASSAGASGLILEPDGALSNPGVLNSSAVLIRDALQVQGHFKATGGIGKIARRAGTTSSAIAPNLTGSSVANCAASEVLTGCSYSTTGTDMNVYQLTTNGDASISPTTCTAVAKNMGSVNATVTAHAVCWNMNI